jgi:hypothetical protein
VIDVSESVVILKDTTVVIMAAVEGAGVGCAVGSGDGTIDG